MAIPRSWEQFTNSREARQNAEMWGRLALDAILENNLTLVQQRAELAGTCARMAIELEKHVHACPVEGCPNFCRCNCEHPSMVWMCPACQDADTGKMLERMAGF